MCASLVIGNSVLGVFCEIARQVMRFLASWLNESHGLPGCARARARLEHNIMDLTTTSSGNDEQGFFDTLGICTISLYNKLCIVYMHYRCELVYTCKREYSTPVVHYTVPLTSTHSHSRTHTHTQVSRSSIVYVCACAFAIISYTYQENWRPFPSVMPGWYQWYLYIKSLNIPTFYCSSFLWKKCGVLLALINYLAESVLLYVHTPIH